MSFAIFFTETASSPTFDAASFPIISTSSPLIEMPPLVDVTFPYIVASPFASISTFVP